MSRLIVKNLPNDVTADKLRNKFSEKGRVTDVQLKYTKDGKFRKFGFVGYHTDEEAQAALEYFNNTFYNTSRIRVEVCAELGTAEKPRAWSKYAPDSSAYKKIHGVKDEKPNKTETEKIDIKKKKKGDTKKIKDEELIDKIKKHKDEPEFVEFLEAHGQDVSDLLKAADDSGVGESDEEKEPKKKEESGDNQGSSLAHAPISDLEYLKKKMKSKNKSEDLQDSVEVSRAPQKVEKEKKKKTFFTVKIRNMPFGTKKKQVKAFLKPLSAASIRVVRNIKGIAYVGFKTEKEMKQALIKNKSFMDLQFTVIVLDGTQVFIKEYKEKKEIEEPAKWKKQEESLAHEESIAESGRLFIRNLSYTVTEDILQEMFSKYGPLTEVVVPIDKYSRKVKGFGVITYLMPEHAVAAYTALDGTILHGRMLHLLPGKPKDQDEDENDEGKSYKDKKNKQLKKNAQSSHTWNTLFLGQDAVAEVIAEKYNATKEQVLTGSDAPVRLALGETQLVGETKRFLEEHGVKLDAFNKDAKKRSKTVILVKNLPAKTTAAELREMFAKHGELDRIILPPSGITGIVEFIEPSEARSAFMKLAYTKFKHLPLYLEWAPEDSLLDKSEIPSKATTEKEKLEEESDDDITPEADTTLFVKNLSFQTTDEALKKHFSTCGKVASATVARKKDASKPGQFLSMGYGFVQYYLKSATNEAIKNLQGSQLDNHTIELKRSNRTVQSDPTVSRKDTNVKNQTGSKILVRNIPFQATVKEITSLFKTFGELKSVRLPKKLVGTGPHRGFGFVEFVTRQDAKRAMKALCQSTHFFGRRLVLEWAENEENIDVLRKRTAAQFLNDITTKKSKKATADISVSDHEKGEGEQEDEEEMDDSD